jgi:hypothetical protein
MNYGSNLGKVLAAIFIVTVGTESESAGEKSVGDYFDVE